MYQFIDKGQNDVCLRPEGTASVVRMFIQEKKDRIGGTFRYFYHGAMFRYERPQKGRLRQFHQFGCESFGEDSVYEDANIILMISQILDFFNIKYTLKLNSLGCKKCMPQYKTNLIKYLENLNLCDDCNKRVVTNPIRVLDCKDNNCQKQLTHAPKITKSLCKNCDDDFTKLQNILNNNNLSYDIDSNLVRGLDYYTKTAFEFISDEIGAKSAIVGGGRYDKLVEFLGGRPTCGIGFAIGIERLLELIVKKDEKNELLYIGAMCEDALDVVFGKVIQKRKLSSVITDYKVRSFSKHINNATKKRVTKIALIGENELKNKTIWVKNLDTKIEKNINMEDF
jgi:histidyl-tRNA synthetase